MEELSEAGADVGNFQVTPRYVAELLTLHPMAAGPL
jgi:hypothetical protein